MIKYASFLIFVSLFGYASVGNRSESEGKVLLESAGYMLHYGPGEREGEYALALFSNVPGFPSINLILNQSEARAKMIWTKEVGGVTTIYSDIDGDGLPDEGIAYNKETGFREKFAISTSVKPKK